MNYLGKRKLDECCPFCGNKFIVNKHINKSIGFLKQNLSFYEFICASEDHLLTDYVSLYLNTTYYRRITCYPDPDAIQLRLDFIGQESEIVFNLEEESRFRFSQSKPTNNSVKFDYILEEYNDLAKLKERLEIYQSFL